MRVERHSKGIWWGSCVGGGAAEDNKLSSCRTQMGLRLDVRSDG